MRRDNRCSADVKEKTSVCVVCWYAHLLTDRLMTFNVTLISTPLSFPSSFCDLSILYILLSHMHAI